jgi:flagellar assembly protein FliH
MPSSPETHTARDETPPWQLAQLRPASVPAAPSVQFTAAPGALPERPPMFEVSASAGVPDALLRQARAGAQAAGYAQGWAAGIRGARVVADAEAHAARAQLQRAAADRAARVQQAVAALDRAAGHLEQQAVPGTAQLESVIIESAFAIAEALVGCTLREDATRGSAALRRALSLAPAGEPVTVSVSSADYALLTADGADCLDRPGDARVVTIVEDAALAPGDATARSGATTVDARLTAALERVREVLGR